MKVRMSRKEIQAVEIFNYLEVRINTDGCIGEKGSSYGTSGKKGKENDDKVVKREHDIWRSKTEVI